MEVKLNSEIHEYWPDTDTTSYWNEISHNGVKFRWVGDIAELRDENGNILASMEAVYGHFRVEVDGKEFE